VKHLTSALSAVALLVLLFTPLAAADGAASGASFGPLFFIAGIFLVAFSPIMGVVSIFSGNIYAAMMWWLLGTTLGVGLLITRMA
jgi:hypothetical protein